MHTFIHFTHPVFWYQPNTIINIKRKFYGSSKWTFYVSHNFHRDLCCICRNGKRKKKYIKETRTKRFTLKTVNSFIFYFILVFVLSLSPCFLCWWFFFFCYFVSFNADISAHVSCWEIGVLMSCTTNNTLICFIRLFTAIYYYYDASNESIYKFIRLYTIFSHLSFISLTKILCIFFFCLFGCVDSLCK